MEQDQNDFLPQPELLLFETRLTEVLHELNIKRRLLGECHLNLEGALSKQHELERMLDVERRDSQAMRLQLKVAVEAVQQCGEERAAASPELSRLRIELETAVRERDCLKEQTHTSQLENLTLNRQIEELQGELCCLQMLQESSINLEAKIRTAVEEVNSEIRKLDQDHRRLERSCEAAEMLGTSLQEAHGCLHRMLKRTEEQLKKYESEVVALRAEVARLKMENRSTPANLYEEWNNDSETSKYLQEIKDFVTAESRGSTQLTLALQKALQAQATFQKLEQEVREKLQKEMEHASVLQSSNDALSKSLHEACETISSLEQQVQELLVKPSFEEQGVQTDVVKLVCEERGTQMDADTSSPDGDGSDVTKKESIVPEDNVQESTYDEQEHELDSNSTKKQIGPD